MRKGIDCQREPTEEIVVTRERVLVVDARPENLKFVVNYVLKPNDYQPLTASDGHEGLSRDL